MCDDHAKDTFTQSEKGSMPDVHVMDACTQTDVSDDHDIIDTCTQTEQECEVMHVFSAIQTDETNESCTLVTLSMRKGELEQHLMSPVAGSCIVCIPLNIFFLKEFAYWVNCMVVW